MLMLPCPLCILQRIAFAAMGVVFLLGGLHSPKGRVGRAIYGAAGCWCPPPPVPASPVAMSGCSRCRPATCRSCGGMGLEYMIEAMGPMSALSKVLQGSGECAKIDWTFLGVSMPAWTLVWFIGLGLGALWAALRKR